MGTFARSNVYFRGAESVSAAEWGPAFCSSFLRTSGTASQPANSPNRAARKLDGSEKKKGTH
jgi:hypothetical protein